MIVVLSGEGREAALEGPGRAQGLAVVQIGWKAGHLKVRKLGYCQFVTVCFVWGGKPGRIFKLGNVIGINE